MREAVFTQSLTKQYSTTLAVDNVNLKVPIGCSCGFLGKNGAGKTTTIKMLVGLLAPTGGEISIMGEERVFGKPGTPNFGYLPDVPNFYGYMTGAEFLHLAGKLCGISEPERGKRVKELLSQVGLEKIRTRISGYSRGMKQRLGIAQALINNPPVIFMDEPISALDPIGRRDVAQIIRSLKDTTVILSTHILADVEDICDYVLIIDNGRILAQDYLQSLKERRMSGVVSLRFYNNEDANSFRGFAANAGLTIEELAGNPLEMKARHGSGDTKELSHVLTGIAYTNNIPLESLGAYAPTIEDIFYEVIG